MFTPSFTPRSEHSLLLEEWRGEQRISPQEITSPPWDKIRPWGTTSPRGQSLPLGAKLRVGISMYKNNCQHKTSNRSMELESCGTVIKFHTTCRQVCQMVYFNTKNPNLDIFLSRF
jgi:hypothetical protein